MSEHPQIIEIPKPTPSPCSECPWRRRSVPGFLGPHKPEEWCEIAHSDAPIACHKTVVVTDPIERTGSWTHPKLRQCRGAAIFRANVCKTPRNPNRAVGPEDKESVFASNDEFINHHRKERMPRKIIVEGSFDLLIDRLESVLDDLRSGNSGYLEDLMGQPNAEIEFAGADPSEDPEGDWTTLEVSYMEGE